LEIIFFSPSNLDYLKQQQQTNSSCLNAVKELGRTPMYNPGKYIFVVEVLVGLTKNA